MCTPNTLQFQDYWSIVTGLATVLAAVATLMTVREMKKGRETAVMPHLQLKRDGPFRFSTHFSIYDFNNHSDFENLQNPLIIENLGLGPANNIEVEWLFDIDNEIKKLKKPDHLIIERSSNAIRFITNMSGNRKIHSVSLSLLKYKVHSLGIGDENRILILPIPVIISQLFAYYHAFSTEAYNTQLYSNTVNSTHQHSSAIRPGPYRLRITYKDSMLKKYSREFLVSLNHAHILIKRTNVNRDIDCVANLTISEL